MSYAQAVYDRLEADATLLTLLSGRIYLYHDLPSKGISRATMPNVYSGYQGSGPLLPLCVVKGRGLIPQPALRDYTTQYTSAAQVIELYFYNDQAAGWDTLKTAADRAYALLHERPLPDSFQCVLVNAVEDMRDPEMENACLLRRDYQITGRIHAP